MNTDYTDPHGFKIQIYVLVREMRLSWAGATAFRGKIFAFSFLIRDNPRQSAVSIVVS
jgi:hypothetical protein